MSTKIFVNLPVRDLERSVAFFKNLGFEFDPRYTDENATAMIVSADIHVMLLVEHFFKTFTRKDVADSTKTTEAIIALGVENRERVDDLYNKAMAAGGGASVELTGMETMYVRSFEDLDGHLWEVFHMDAVPGN